MTGWRAYLWLGVWFLSAPFGAAGRGSWQAVAAVVVGAVVGTSWQALARRDPTARLTWLAGGALVFGFLLMLDAAIGSGSSELEVGPTAYLVAVASAVVLTEQVLRRRDLGPVTLDLVHSADDAVEAGARRPDPGRRTGA